MDIILGDLNTCCQGLRSEKITERKKQADLFRALIDQPKCIAALDKCSIEKRGLSWERVCLAVIEYVQKEIESALKNAKKPLKSSATTNRKAQTTSNLFKLFIRKANARGSRLNCTHVLRHILQVLDNSSIHASFGVDYCSVLLKDVILVPQMRCEISQTWWQEMLNLMCTKYSETSGGLDKVFLLKVIENIITYGSKQTIIDASALIKFFRNGFDSLKKQVNQGHFEGFLSALLAFCYAYADEHRLQMCQIGETVFPIISDWWDSRPMEGLKLVIVRFWEFQVSIHHPCGVFTNEKGAYSDDHAVWKNCLHRMYSFFLIDIRNFTLKNKKASQLPSCYLNLIAQTCRQVSYINSEEINHEADDDLFSAPKRRRKDGPVNDILEEINKNANMETSIIWLQILAHYLNLFPDSLTSNLFNSLLPELLQLLVNCKKGLISEYLLEVCCTCIKCHEHLETTGALTNTEKHTINENWKQIYDRALRLFTLNQAKEECLKLIKLLILNKLVKPNVELWCVFTSKQNLSNSLLQVLASYLQQNEMPNRNPLEVLSQSTEEFSNDVSNASLRLHLINFLLRPLLDEDEIELQTHFSCIDFKLLSQILVTLCLWSPLDFTLSADSNPNWVNRNDRSELEFLENFFLKSTFNTEFVEYKDELEKQITTNLSSSSVMIEKLFAIILRDLQILLGHTKSEINSISIACNYCCLVMCIIRLLLDHKLLAAIEICAFKFYDKLEALFVILTQSIGIFCDRGNKQTNMQLVTETLQTFCSDVLESNDEVFIRKLIPTQLVWILFEFLKNQICTESTKEKSLDDGFFDELMETEFDTRSSDGSPAQTQSSKLRDSILNLTANEPVDLCAKCLCAFNYFDVNARFDSGNNVKFKIMELFLNDNFDDNSPSNLHLVLNTIYAMFKGKKIYDGEIVKQSVLVLRRFSKVYHKHMDIVIKIFDTILLLISHLYYCLANEREELLSLLYSFWKRHKKRPMSSYATLGFIKCINALIKIDPFNAWTRWSLEDSPDTIPVSIHLIDMMKPENNYLVQLNAADSVANLVKVKPQICHLTSGIAEWQISVLRRVCAVKEEWKLTSTPKNIADVEVSINQQCVFVMSLTNIAALNSFCEKKVILTILVAILENKILIDVVMKACGRIAKYFGYSNMKSYLQSHFDYLIFNWLSSERHIFTFPYQLLGFRSTDTFARAFYPIIVPWLLVTGNQLMAIEISKVLQKDMKSLIIECFSRLAVYMLPFLAVKEDLTETLNCDISFNHAISCYEFIESELTPEVFDNLLRVSINEIIVGLLSCLQPEQKIAVVFSSRNPPCYISSVIQRTCHYIMSKLKMDQNSIIVVLSKEYSIQSILLSLRINIVSVLRVFERFRLFLAYKTFVQWVFEELELLGELKIFLISDVVHTVVYLILEYSKENDIAINAIRFLCEVSERILQVSPQDLGNLLSFIVNSLLPLLYNTDLKNEIIALFEMLLLRNVDKMCTFIQVLDPFPNIPELSEISDVHRRLKYPNGDLKLRDEINCFLENSKIETGGTLTSRLEGLRYLRKELSELKIELCNITQSPTEMPRFTEDCQNSIIHRLIAELICLSSSKDADIAVEAVRCLGEIGPIDLNSLVLQIDDGTKPYKQELALFTNDSIGHRNAILLKLLSENLFNMDAKLVSLASSVVKTFLSTNSGKKFILQYETQRQEDNLFCILKHFKGQNVIAVANDELNEDVILTVLNDDFIWFGVSMNGYDVWIRDLVCKLIEITSDEILRSVIPIAKHQVKFCQKIFPLVMYTILKDCNERVKNILSEKVNEFFQIQYKKLTSSDNRVMNETKEAIKTMLSVVNYLRLQKKSIASNTSQWDQNFWLDLNYLNVAIAAEACSANFSALMFLRIWCDSKSQETKSEDYNKTYNFAHILADVSGNSEVYELILKTYRNIGDVDGCYGFQIGDIELPIKRIHEYEYELKWNEAFAAYSRDSEKNSCYMMGMLKCLKMLGNTQALEMCLKGIKVSDNEEYKEFQYECMWRTCQWSLPRDKATETQFNKSIYNVVTDIYQDDESRFNGDMRDAYNCVVKNLSTINLENMFSVYSALAQSQILVQLEDYKIAKNDLDDPLELMNRKWQTNDRFICYNFLFTEPIVTNQIVLTQLDRNLPTNSQVLGERLLLKSKLAREAKYLDLAASTVAQAKNLHDLDQKLMWYCEMEEARIFWDREESTTAIQKIRKLLSNFDKDENSGNNSSFHAKALGLFSKWLIETKSEIPNTILQHLNEAITLSTQGEANSDMTDVYLEIGRYLDSNYQQITAHMESAEFESTLNLINLSKDYTDKLEKQNAAMNKDQQRSMIYMKKQSMLDEQEVKNMIENQKGFLKQTLKCYLACLKNSGTHDLRIFRVITLWFENHTNDDINKQILTSFKQISSHKLLPLMHQLAARISCIKSNFQTTLNELIEKICSDHPHHSLNIILALYNAYKGEDEKTESRQLQYEKDRVTAAEQIISKLEKKKHLNAIIDKQKKLSLAYISFSNYNGSEKRAGASVAIPPKMLLLNLPLLFGVSIPTDDIPVNQSGIYNVPHIVSFEPHYKLCGGINVPKVLVCLGSDGRKRIQLLKGQDDLRQDAVMQQVFGVVNMLLNQNNETKKKNLHIRTYKVVPLSQRSGIVQWCEGTQPFGDCVISAHSRYHPDEYNTTECRSKIMKVAQSKLETKLQVFENICSNFHPALHYFFFENFLEPVVWFERTQAYTKSVATSSIVGYILGLGDRHVANILLDKTTAEVIHIDLGVAFDQGKLLPIPEKIPFRLTRDVVDGMGITGIEGVFRKSCERTLEVLRQSQEIVLTLLEVLLYDPLYTWTLTPEKMANLQEKKAGKGRGRKSAGGDATASKNHEENNINKHAQRVLLRLQQKLQGLEGGTRLSVNGQVNYLIKEAVNPRNLCALFAGWQPYL